jgi:hypothetical protein
MCLCFSQPWSHIAGISSMSPGLISPFFNQRGFPHEGVSVESKTEGAYALSGADIF